MYTTLLVGCGGRRQSKPSDFFAFRHCSHWELTLAPWHDRSSDSTPTSTLDYWVLSLWDSSSIPISILNFHNLSKSVFTAKNTKSMDRLPRHPKNLWIMNWRNHLYYWEHDIDARRVFVASNLRGATMPQVRTCGVDTVQCARITILTSCSSLYQDNKTYNV